MRQKFYLALVLILLLIVITAFVLFQKVIISVTVNAPWASCNYNGIIYKNGQSFQDNDGCNTCGCRNGEISCTAMACVPNPTNPPKPLSGCKTGGCSNELCVDEKSDNTLSPCIYRAEYSCYKNAVCEKQLNGKCQWTITKELQDCLFEKKNNE